MHRWTCFMVVASSALAGPVVVELRDGSRLVGEVDADALSLATQYGTVKVKLADLASVTSLDDKERVAVRAVNGDTFTGVPSPPKLELKTSFGKVTLPFTQIVRLQPGAAPAPAVASPPLGTEPPNGTLVSLLTFRCADLTSVNDLGQTTGGSVFLWEANLATGPTLLLLAATREPGSSSGLAAVARTVSACKGSARRIVVKDAKYVAGTDTTSGVRKGWTAFYPNVTVQ